MLWVIIAIMLSPRKIEISNKCFALQERDEQETCAAFIFGPEYDDVQIVFQLLAADPEYRKISYGESSCLKEGDVVVYKSEAGEPTHVRIVGRNGQIFSKFAKNRRIHIHSLWDPETIPNNIFYQRVEIFRKIQ